MCTICIFIVLCTACGGKEKNLKSVSFSDHNVYLGETKEQLKKDFGNFLSEDGNKITLLDEKKGNLSLTMMNDKVAFINSDDKSIDYNGLNIGSSIEDVSSCLGVDKNFIGNNSSVQIFYNKDNEIVYKSNKEVYSTTSPVPSDDEDHSGYTTTFFKNYSAIKKSKFMVEAYVYDGKVSSLNLLSSSAYLKLTKINSIFAGNKIFYLDKITKKDVDNMLGDDTDLEDDNNVFTYKNTDSDSSWNNYVIFKGRNIIGELDFSKKDNGIFSCANKSSDFIINNLYIGEPIADASKSLNTTEAFVQKTNDVVFYYDVNGKQLAKYDDAKAFMESSESAPSDTAYQVRIKFANNKINYLSILTY